MRELSLFPEMEIITETWEPEPIPEPIPITRKFKKRIIGDNFIIVKCLNCDQLIMVDPVYYPEDKYRDKICEACDERYQDKYMKYLKLKLR